MSSTADERRESYEWGVAHGRSETATELFNHFGTSSVKKVADQVEMMEGILRKIIQPEHDWEQHYVDLESGVIDVRVRFTEDEVGYLRTLEPDNGEGAP